MSLLGWLYVVLHTVSFLGFYFVSGKGGKGMGKTGYFYSIECRWVSWTAVVVKEFNEYLLNVSVIQIR